jgi:hypothetical protein
LADRPITRSIRRLIDGPDRVRRRSWLQSPATQTGSPKEPEMTAVLTRPSRTITSRPGTASITDRRLSTADYNRALARFARTPGALIGM